MDIQRCPRVATLTASRHARSRHRSAGWRPSTARTNRSSPVPKPSVPRWPRRQITDAARSAACAGWKRLNSHMESEPTTLPSSSRQRRRVSVLEMRWSSLHMTFATPVARCPARLSAVEPRPPTMPVFAAFQRCPHRMVSRRCLIFSPVALALPRGRSEANLRQSTRWAGARATHGDPAHPRHGSGQCPSSPRLGVATSPPPSPVVVPSRSLSPWRRPEPETNSMPRGPGSVLPLATCATALTQGLRPAPARRCRLRRFGSRATLAERWKPLDDTRRRSPLASACAVAVSRHSRAELTGLAAPAHAPEGTRAGT